jgi:orotidine-5'-phosphate decarboxylase
MNIYTKVIVALDKKTEKEILSIAKLLEGKVWGFKLNDFLFENPHIIKKLKKYGKVFADAKLHDIPNTVHNSTQRLSDLGSDLITIHAKGGIEMMRQAVKAKGKAKILAVTVLTSDKEDLKLQKKLILDSIKAKVDGIVCSGLDIPKLNGIKGLEKLLKVTPGIRFEGSKKGDQVRVCTPELALRNGSDLLVIGRDWKKLFKIKEKK